MAQPVLTKTLLQPAKTATPPCALHPLPMPAYLTSYPTHFARTNPLFKIYTKLWIRNTRYKNLLIVSWIGFEGVGPAALLTIHLYVPPWLSLTFSICRVLAVSPDTPGIGSKSVPPHYHLYVRSPPPVALTVNFTVDPGITPSRGVGCFVIWGGSTGG